MYQHNEKNDNSSDNNDKYETVMKMIIQIFLKRPNDTDIENYLLVSPWRPQ